MSDLLERLKNPAVIATRDECIAEITRLRERVANIEILRKATAGALELVSAERDAARAELPDARANAAAHKWRADCAEEREKAARAELAQVRAEAEVLRPDAERLDFVERHLCRAGDVVDDRGTVRGIVKAWQIVTQLDEPLRLTIDRLQAAHDAAREGT